MNRDNQIKRSHFTPVAKIYADESKRIAERPAYWNMTDLQRGGPPRAGPQETATDPITGWQMNTALGPKDVKVQMGSDGKYKLPPTAPATAPNANASMQQTKSSLHPQDAGQTQGGFKGAFDRMAGPLGGALANNPYTKTLAKYSDKMGGQRANELQLNQTAQYFLSKGVKEEDVIYALQQAKAGNPKVFELIQKKLMEGGYEEKGNPMEDNDAKWKADKQTRAREMARLGPEIEALEAKGVQLTGLLDKVGTHAESLDLARYAQNAWLSDDDDRTYRSKAAQWINNVLRDQSGAAVPEAEHKRYMTAYFPDIGEGPEQVKAKAQARRELHASMTASLTSGETYNQFQNRIRERFGFTTRGVDGKPFAKGNKEDTSTNTGVDGVVKK